MAKMKLNPEAPEESSALVPAASTAVSTPANVPAAYNPDDYDSGAKDVEHPSLGLINSTGERAKNHRADFGKWLLGDSAVLGTSVQVIPLGIRKFYVESKRGGAELKYSDKTKKRFDSARSAAEAGYLVFGFETRGQPNLVDECAKLVLLVREPAGDKSGEFFLPAPDGKRYALATSAVQREGFRNVYLPIYNRAVRAERSRALAENRAATTEPSALRFHDALWTFGSDERSKDDNTWVVATCSFSEALTPEMVAWIEKNVGGVAI